MLSKGSGLFHVDPAKRSAGEKEALDSHPWRTRLSALLHEAGEFHADWVYFRLSVGAGAPRPELFIYDWQRDGLGGGSHAPLAELYRELWNYGRVPLALILKPTTVDFYNLLPRPTFDAAGNPGEPVQVASLGISSAESLGLAAAAASSVAEWERFTARQFDSGAFWEAEENQSLASGLSSLDSLVSDMRDLRRDMEARTTLTVPAADKAWFVRRLLIITLMVRFLEDRGILPQGYFKDAEYLGADDFKSLLRHPRALLHAIGRLESDFNGDVFHVDPLLRNILSTASESALIPIANFATGNMQGEQQFFWKRYSFRSLPVEVISYVYEDFLGGKSQAYFTPHHLVDLLLDEAMPEKQIFSAFEAFDPRNDRSDAAFPVLDPACGSGVFLVGAWRRLVDAFRLLEQAPTPATLKKLMVDNIFGVDIEKESVELTIFSLCVALCSDFPLRRDDPSYVFDQLRQLKFPNLKNGNVHEGDFFNYRQGAITHSRRFRLVIGNPPFESKLGAGHQEDFNRKSTDEDGKKWSPVPDNQISYLFLRGVLPLLSDECVACLVQPAGFIYNDKTAEYRKETFSNWNLFQILDFASIAGLFTARKKIKGGAAGKIGVKTVAVFVRRAVPPKDRPVLHATFRRTSLLNHRKIFEIDHQDLHWIPLPVACEEPRVWKANLLGGGRLLETYKSFTAEQTLGQYIGQLERERNWICSEGFIEAAQNESETNEGSKVQRHLRPAYANYDLLQTEHLTEEGIDTSEIRPSGLAEFDRPRDERLFTPPHLLIKENESLPLALRESGNKLLFRHEIIGVAVPREDLPQLRALHEFLLNLRPHFPFFASFGPRYLVGRQTALLKKDIMNLPFPEGGKLVFRGVQKHLRDDVIKFMVPLIKDVMETRQRLMAAVQENQIVAYAEVFAGLMRTVYPDFKFIAAHDLMTGWCAAFHKGSDAPRTFGDSEGLRKHVDALLSRETGRALRTWRIVRHFSGNDLFIIKPKPMRYWLKSAAVSDADQVFAWVMHGAKRKSATAVAVPSR